MRKTSGACLNNMNRSERANTQATNQYMMAMSAYFTLALDREFVNHRSYSLNDLCGIVLD